MILLWATRGREWGFRFLIGADLAEPLAIYEAAFAPLADAAEGCVANNGRVALRLLDPDGRRDRAGRLILHEFVLDGGLGERVRTVEDGRREVWPLVAGRYADAWDEPIAPRSARLRSD